MIKTAINSLLNSGTDSVTFSSKKRNIWLTNVASFFISGFYIIVLLNRAALGRLTNSHAMLLLVEAFIIFIPILLNKFRYYNISRIIICWFPITSLFYNAIVNFSGAVPESSTYVGFRLFIIAFACTPFLVFNTSERINLIIALTVPVLCLALYDPIFTFFGYGYSQVGLHEVSYSYNNFRTFVSYSILSLSFYFLKQALEKREEINERLLVELEEKNKTIQQQADKDVSQLNNQLLGAYNRLNYHVNNTPLAIIERDKNLNITFWNKRAEELFEWTQTEVTGKKIYQFLVPQEDIESAKKLLEEMVEGEINSSSKEVRNISKSGKILFCKWYYSLLRNEDGSIQGLLAFVSDMTEDNLRAKELGEALKKIGEALKKIGELRLMALRSVMNPHFIFNVLNSIQFYIVNNDRLNAVNYLSTFSKLIRSILTHSVDNKIRLEDEITMLKHYVQLEMVRFEDKFDFKLEVDEDLETDSIEIPSLLIQPYVENAILHGLYNKEEKGRLTIRIREEDDSVVFEIEDDGVGREAAMKIRQQSLADHKSLGVKLTEERLKLINEHHNVSSQIIDLMKDDNPCGTKAIIWVKIF